jgi:glycosyltransferase involved in cell wall biosynthesis
LDNDEDVMVFPYLDKSNKDDAQMLDKLYRENDLLLLPTRADCTPVVISEAAAYGLPVITTDTGGITSVVHDGENGFCLPASSPAPDYANLIRRIWDNKESFVNLRMRTRETYEKRLNWKNWLKVFNQVTAHLYSF